MALSSPTRQDAIATYASYKAVPWIVVAPVIAAVRNGATYTQAANAGGVPPSHVSAWLAMGDSGRYPIWTPVADNLRRARWAAEEAATKRRKQLASAEDASMAHTQAYLEKLEQDSYLPPAENVQGGGGPRIQINIQREFERLPEPEPKVIDVGTPTVGDQELLEAGDE